MSKAKKKLRRMVKREYVSLIGKDPKSFTSKKKARKKVKGNQSNKGYITRR